jgi:hypothetical protein
MRPLLLSQKNCQKAPQLEMLPGLQGFSMLLKLNILFKKKNWNADCYHYARLPSSEMEGF